MEFYDFIATNKPFLYKGRSTYETAFGGLLTILFVSLALVISYSYLEILFLHNEYSALNKFEASYINGWDEVNISVLLKINKTEEKIFLPYYQINERDTININKTCKEEELQLFGESPESPLFSAYCVHINSFSRWSFKIRCYFERARKMGLDCESDERAVVIKVQAQEFASESYSEIKNKIFEFSKVTKNNTNFYYNFNKLIIDKGLFFNSPEVFYFSDFSDINSYPQWFAGKDSVMSVLFEFKPQKTFLIEKVCKKFNQELAKILALSQLLMICFNVVYQVVADFLFERENLRNLLEIVDVSELAPQACDNSEVSEVVSRKIIYDTEESLLKLFCFSNYLFINIFPFCYISIKFFPESTQKYINIRKKLTSICSYENFICEPDPTRDALSKSSASSPCSTLNSFLSSFDFLAPSPIILIENNAVFKTKFGGILFILMLTAGGIFFYIFGEDFFKQQNPTVSYNENKLISLNNTGFELDVPFMIGMSKNYAAATKLLYFTLDNQTYNDAQAKKCTLEEIRSFNITEPDMNLDYSCFNYKQVVKDPVSARDIYLFGELCDNLAKHGISDAECKGHPEPEFKSTIVFEFYKKTRKIVIENFSKNNYFNYINNDKNYVNLNSNTNLNNVVNNNKKNSITEESKNNFNKQLDEEWVITNLRNSPLYDLNPNSFYNFHITDRNKINKVTINDHYFLSSRKTSFSITNPPFVQTNSEPFLLNKIKRFGVLLIQINPILLETKVVYQKFDQMLARVMSLISLLYFILKILNKYFSNYFLLEKFKNDFFMYLKQTKPKRFLGEKPYLLNVQMNKMFKNSIKNNNNNNNNNSSVGNIKETEVPEVAAAKPQQLLKLITFWNFVCKRYIWVCYDKTHLYKKIYKEFRASLSSESFIKFSNCIRDKAVARSKTLFKGERENIGKMNQSLLPTNNFNINNKNNNINYSNLNNSLNDKKIIFDDDCKKIIKDNNVNNSNTNLNLINNNLNHSNNELNLNNNNSNDDNHVNYNNYKNPHVKDIVNKYNYNFDLQKKNKINKNHNYRVSYYVTFLKIFDFLFVYDNFFYFKNNKSFKTAIGGLISCLYLILVVFLTVFFISDFWTGKIIAIRSNQLSFYEVENKTNDLNVPFALGFSRELADAVYFQRKHYTEKSASNKTSYPECSDSELVKFNQSLALPASREKIFFVCSNFNELLEQPYLFYQQLSIDFYIAPCSKSKLNNPAYPSCNKIPNLTSVYYSEIYYITDEIDYAEFTTSKKIVKYSKRGVYTDLMRILIQLQRYEIRDKPSQTLGNHVDSSNKGKSQRLIYALSDTVTKDNWITIKPFMDQTMTLSSKELVYESLPEALARVFAMIGIAKAIFYFLHFSVFKFLYFKSVWHCLLTSKESKKIKQRFLTETGNQSLQEIFKDFKNNESELTESDETFLFLEFCEKKVFRFTFYLMANFSFLFRNKLREYLIIEKTLKEYISIETLYRSKIKMQVKILDDPNNINNNNDNNMKISGKINSLCIFPIKRKLVLRKNTLNSF